MPDDFSLIREMDNIIDAIPVTMEMNKPPYSNLPDMTLEI